MIRPDADVMKVFEQLARNAVFKKWFEQWRTHELERLPNVQSDTIQVAQGRCQVLTEFHKLLQDNRNASA